MFAENTLGFEYQDKDIIVFFGKKNCTLEALKGHYPKIEFRIIKQTHSCIVIPSAPKSENIEADAHYTHENNVGLVVRTADCLPILVCSSQNKIIAAIHAGWRGVENQITAQTLRSIPQEQDLKIFIGPHILKKSFEVKEDVKDLLASSTSDSYEKRGDNYYVDLQKIVVQQIHSVSALAEIKTIDLDTFKNPQFNSFRTDKTPQRNLSFIAQKTAPV